MATIRETIDIGQPIDTVSSTWAHFVKWVLLGHYRFVCDELTCARAIDAEVTSFQRLDGHHTRVIVELDYDEIAGADLAKRHLALSTHLQRDLMRFKDFAEARESGVDALHPPRGGAGKSGKAHPDPPAEARRI